MMMIDWSWLWSWSWWNLLKFLCSCRQFRPAGGQIFARKWGSGIKKPQTFAHFIHTWHLPWWGELLDPHSILYFYCHLLLCYAKYLPKRVFPAFLLCDPPVGKTIYLKNKVLLFFHLCNTHNDSQIGLAGRHFSFFLYIGIILPIFS